MKAVVVHACGGADQLRHEDLPLPAAGPGEVRVRARAMSVNPVDYKMRGGFAKLMFPQLAFPIVLGTDLAGVVDQVGEGVTAFEAGDKVFGMIGLLGGYAEAVVFKAEQLAKMPLTMDFVQAASVPLAALTAWQALIETAKLQAGQKLLIHGAAGGVGTFAVQLARWKGAQVTATASAANLDYLRGLGADAVIDYRSTTIEAMPGGFDAVLDLAGDDAGARSIPLMNAGGIVVVVNGRPAPRSPDEQGRRLAGIVVQSSGAMLAQVAAAIDSGHVRAEIARTFPLADVAAAHALIEQGHTRGKIVLTVA